MSSATLAPSVPAAFFRPLRPAVPALVLGVLVFGLLFRAEAAAAVSTWWVSTAYSHCFFVLPIAIYLAWDRREALAGVRLRPLPWLALLLLPLGALWFAVERVGVMEGRQLVAMTGLEVLFLAVLGWQAFRALAPPLLYLFFLVPFGAFVTTPLQNFTTWFIVGGLDLLSIPYISDGYTIDIPAGSFYVAEACAGLRFLIASIAFGVLYAFLNYRSPGRRIAFVAASIVIPIVANGFRGLGIVVLGHLLGSAEAAATDHVLYGWMFFSIVIVLLILAGMPFREDLLPLPARPPSPGHDAGTPQPLRAAAAVVGVMAIAPLAALALDTRAGAEALPMPPAFVASYECQALPDAPLPDIGTTGRIAWGRVQRFDCNGQALTVLVKMFPGRSNPGAVLAAQRMATGELAAEDSSVGRLTVDQTQPRDWRLLETREPDRLTASAIWLDGKPSPGGMAARLAQAWHSVAGAARGPVLVAVTARAEAGQRMGPTDRDRAREAMRALIDAQQALAAEVAGAAP